MSTRVLPTAHEFVQRTLRDFRVRENGERWIARIRGEGRFRSSVLPEASEREPKVLVELIPVSEWTRPNLLWRWLTAFRLPYLTISLLPLLLVLCAHLRTGAGTPWPLTILLFSSVALIHLGCNLWGDYEDHLRGVDNPGQSGGSGVIQKLWIPAVHLKFAAAVLFLSGCALGVALLTQLPLELVSQRLLWLGLLGAFGAASYSGWPFHYKYFGLGEPIVFLLSGPLVAAGAAALYFPENADLLRFSVLSLPLAFLVVLRLHSGNMQRIPFDSIARVLTIARVGGFGWSKLAYAFLVCAPFLTVIPFWALELVGPSALLCQLAFPFALFTLRDLRLAKGPLDPACYRLRSQAALLHLLFGLAYCVSFLLS
ncbi:MAG TPA: prenyltransferase [Bdellovibrionota bacterium]|jgi:1,4-dihydroxy-2-naphthoate octaprenyltransferase